MNISFISNLIVGFFIGYYLGNERFRDKVNKWIFKDRKKKDTENNIKDNLDKKENEIND